MYSPQHDEKAGGHDEAVEMRTYDDVAFDVAAEMSQKQPLPPDEPPPPPPTPTPLPPTRPPPTPPSGSRYLRNYFDSTHNGRFATHGGTVKMTQIQAHTRRTPVKPE